VGAGLWVGRSSVAPTNGYDHAVALAQGTHELGPESGTLRVHTYREGMAQKIGHDLIIDVRQWQATVEIEAGGAPTAIVINVDSTSLEVREGLRGVKPLTDKDRAEIRSNIEQKVLSREPITFRSSAAELTDGRLAVRGELTIAGRSRPVAFELQLSDDGRLTGTLPVTQSEWGIKPYRAFMGALKVRDAVDVVLDVALPTSAP
jgi:polyisoprenoid-binding protein YceI